MLDYALKNDFMYIHRRLSLGPKQQGFCFLQFFPVVNIKGALLILLLFVIISLLVPNISNY